MVESLSLCWKDENMVNDSVIGSEFGQEAVRRVQGGFSRRSECFSLGTELMLGIEC